MQRKVGASWDRCELDIVPMDCGSCFAVDSLGLHLRIGCQV